MCYTTCVCVRAHARVRVCTCLCARACVHALCTHVCKAIRWYRMSPPDATILNKFEEFEVLLSEVNVIRRNVRFSNVMFLSNANYSTGFRFVIYYVIVKFEIMEI